MTQQLLPYRFLAAVALWFFSGDCMANALSYPDLYPPLNGTKATTAILDDVPGCACQAHWCPEEERTHFSYTDEEMDHVATCPFLGSAYGFFDVLPSGLICDELQANDDFRRAYGDLGNTGFPDEWNNSYYNVGGPLLRVESGNCDTVYQRQQQCSADPSTYYSTARWAAPYPMTCRAFDFPLPTTNKTLTVASACLSSFEEVDSPRDDRWLLYASWQYVSQITITDMASAATPRGVNQTIEEYVDFCPRYDTDAETRAASLLQNRSSYPYFPIMGREDWIEPVEGRRYMGYDFVDDQEPANEYCLWVLSLGYEPCQGSPTTRSSSIRSSSPSSSAAALLLAFGIVATLF